LAMMPAPGKSPQRALDPIQDSVAPRIGLMQAYGHLQWRHQVIVEAFEPPVAGEEIDTEADKGPVEEGKGIDHHHMTVARNGLGLDDQFGMVAIQALRNPAIEIDQALRIGRAGAVLPLA